MIRLLLWWDDISSVEGHNAVHSIKALMLVVLGWQELLLKKVSFSERKMKVKEVVLVTVVLVSSE